GAEPLFPALRGDPPQILTQTRDIEVQESLGEAPARASPGGAKALRKHGSGRGLRRPGRRDAAVGAQRSRPREEVLRHVEVAARPGGPGQSLQVPDGAPDLAALGPHGRQGQNHAQTARSDADLMNRFLSTGHGEWKIHEEILYSLPDEGKNGISGSSGSRAHPRPPCRYGMAQRSTGHVAETT